MEKRYRNLNLLVVLLVVTFFLICVISKLNNSPSSERRTDTQRPHDPNEVIGDHKRKEMSQNSSIDVAEKSSREIISVHDRLVIIVNEIADFLIQMNHKINYTKKNSSSKCYRYSSTDYQNTVKAMVRLRTLCETFGHKELSRSSKLDTVMLQREFGRLIKYMEGRRVEARKNRGSSIITSSHIRSSELENDLK